MQSIRSASIFYWYLVHVLVISVYLAFYLLANKFNERDWLQRSYSSTFFLSSF